MNFVTLLNQVGQRPGMYFGGRGDKHRMELVEAFIAGHQSALQFPDSSPPFTHFTRWVAAHYRVTEGAKNGFQLIREHVGDDERLAFDEFFGLLPAYARDMAELGPDGVHKHYGEVMAQISDDS